MPPFHVICLVVEHVPGEQATIALESEAASDECVRFDNGRLLSMSADSPCEELADNGVCNSF